MQLHHGVFVWRDSVLPVTHAGLAATAQVAVGLYTTCARRLLRLYDGYECKEPEPGKFTLVFK